MSADPLRELPSEADTAPRCADCGNPVRVVHTESATHDHRARVAATAPEPLGDIFDRLMALWQEPWSEPAFGEAQMLVARLRAVLAPVPAAEPDAGPLIDGIEQHAMPTTSAGKVLLREHSSQSPHMARHIVAVEREVALSRPATEQREGLDVETLARALSIAGIPWHDDPPMHMHHAKLIAAVYDRLTREAAE